MLQQTPLAVTVAPPSLEILPPLDAVVVVTAEMAVVVRVGSKATVVKDICVPYAVPTLFVA